MFNTLVYTAEGHPTADRLYRLRKLKGIPGLAFRNVNAWVDGQTEQGRTVLVESLDSPIAQEYIDKGYVADLRKNRRDPLDVEFTIRVLRKRHRIGKEVVIDLDAEEQREQPSAYLAQNRPITKEGQKKLAAHKKAKAKKARRI